MIKITNLLLLVLALSLCKCQTPSTETPRSLMFSNFMSGLNAFKESTILNVMTAYHYKVCKAIWDKEGSICSAKKVLEYAQSHAKITSRQLNLEKNIPKFDMPISLKIKSSPSRSVFMGSKSFSDQISQTLAKAKAAVERIVHLFQQAHKYKEMMGSCFNYLRHARDLSICYACSAKNSMYFYKEKALISETDCNSMLGACLPFFRLNFLIILEAGSEEVSAILFKNNDHKNGDIVKKLYTAIVKANLKSLVESYDSSTGKAKQQKADELCLKLFRLHKHQLFAELSAALVQIQNAVEKERKLLMIWDAAFENPGSSDDIFAGDVSILRSDSNQRSEILASSGVVPVAGDSYRSMNFSLAFP